MGKRARGVQEELEEEGEGEEEEQEEEASFADTPGEDEDVMGQ